MIVEALHPASMHLVPARARNPRHVHVAQRTAVEVAEVPADALSPWGGKPGGRWPHRFRVAGRPGAWAPLSWIGGGAVGRDELRLLLEGHAGESGIDLHGVDLRGTPLCAYGSLDAAAAVNPQPPSTRGEAVDPDSARSIQSDGRERARSAVRAHVAEGYLVAGDRVLVRQIPLAVGWPLNNFVLDLHGANAGVRLWGAEHMLASPATIADVAREEEMRMSAHLAEWSGYADALPEGTEARIVLDNLPGHVRRWALETLQGGATRGGPEDMEALRGVVAALVPLEIDGMTGTCGLEDAAEAMRILINATVTVREASPRLSPVCAYARTMARRIEGLYAPTLSAPASASEDEDVLSGLGVGP
jgi:hypothetical protein